MNDEDKNAFLEDFRNSDIDIKIDMWFYAMEQVGLWDEAIAELSGIATKDSFTKGKPTKQE